MIKQATEIFKINLSTYPNSSNAYNSLAESYYLTGDKALALQNFEKAFQLNPNNAYAKSMCDRLKASN